MSVDEEEERYGHELLERMTINGECPGELIFELKDKRDALEKKVAELEGELRVTESHAAEMSRELRELQAQLERANDRIEVMHTLRSRMSDQLDRATEPPEYEGEIDEGAEHYGCVEFPGGRRRADVVAGSATKPRAIDPDYHERCEDELQWWRQTHTDEEPPADIWKESARTPATKRLFIDGKPGPPLSMGFKTKPRADGEPWPMSEAARKACDRCNGSGSILSESDSRICEGCHGTGWLPTSSGGEGEPTTTDEQVGE